MKINIKNDFGLKYKNISEDILRKEINKKCKKIMNKMHSLEEKALIATIEQIKIYGGKISKNNFDIKMFVETKMMENMSYLDNRIFSHKFFYYKDKEVGYCLFMVPQIGVSTIEKIDFKFNLDIKKIKKLCDEKY